MRILFIGDVHLSDTNPRSRRDDYLKALLGKLDQCAELVKRHSYQHVFLLGDLFHKKKPDNNTHKMVGEVIDVLRCFPKNQTYALVGNHDIRDGNLGCLPEQPLGVVYKSGALQPLDKDMILIEGALTVQIAPLSFSYDAETNPEMYDCLRQPGVDYLIRMTHASILPVGLPELAYKMPHVGVEKIWGQNWNLLVNGHVHHHSEVITTPHTANLKCPQSFVNVGAIARGALNSWAFEQTPRVLGIRLDKQGSRVAMSYDWHELKVGLPEEVFRVEDALRVKEHKAGMEEFVDGIRSSEVSLSAKTFDLGHMIDEFLNAQQVGESIKRKVKEYVGLR